MKKRHVVITALALTSMCVTAIAFAGCDSHTHTLESVAKEEATCTAAGHEAYFKCTDPECGKLFSDAEGKTEITAAPVIAAKGHSMTKHDGVPVTCTTDGTAEYYTCANEAETIYYANEQGTEKLTDLTVKKTGHKMTKHDANAPTCDAAGNKVYWTCDNEGEGILYANEDGTETTTMEQITVAKKEHTVVPVDAVPATCVSKGMQAYFTCLNCDRIYSDADGETEIKDKSSLEIPINENHTGELTFDYDEAPAAEAAGGVLKATCSDCKKEAAITYSTGVGVAATSSSNPTSVGEGDTVYAVSKDGNSNCWFGIVINSPGTYTLTFTSVHLGTSAITGVLYAFYAANSAYCTSSFGSDGAIIASKNWADQDEHLTDLGRRLKGTLMVNGQPYDPNNAPQNSMTVAFTVTNEDLVAGNLYVSINYYYNGRKKGNPLSSVLFSVSSTQKENVSSDIQAEQVALLPSKDHE